MGWTAGAFDGPLTARAAIAFDLGEEFVERVIANARYGAVIYAAVRSVGGREVFGLVLLAERRDGVLFTKPIFEDMGPIEDHCPARILDLLSETSDEHALDWRRRCRARLARGCPHKGQTVIFAAPLRFLNGAEHRVLTYEGGSRFRSREGALYRVPFWSTLEYRLRDS